jgi:hypothetical protein
VAILIGLATVWVTWLSPYPKVPLKCPSAWPADLTANPDRQKAWAAGWPRVVTGSRQSARRNS